MATCLSGFGRPLNSVSPRFGVVQREPWPVASVRAFVRDHRRVSAGALRRRLRLRLELGERVLAQLEQEGVVGPRANGGSREVLS